MADAYVKYINMVTGLGGDLKIPMSSNSQNITKLKMAQIVKRGNWRSKINIIAWSKINFLKK